LLLALCAVAVARWSYDIPYQPQGQPIGWHDPLYNLFPPDSVNTWVNAGFALAGSTLLNIGNFGFVLVTGGLLPEKGIHNEPWQGFSWSSSGWTSSPFDQGKTDDQSFDGQAVITVKCPSTPTVIPVDVVLLADLEQTKFPVFCMSPNTTTVVFDIDGTLTTDNGQLIEEIVLKIFQRQYNPKMYQGAADMANLWFNKGYQIVYLTGRPGLITNMTLDWLMQMGFPFGGLFLSQGFIDGIFEVEKFKQDMLLNNLTNAGQSFIYAAYGNEPTDAQAYAAASVSKNRTFIIGPNAGVDGTKPITGDYMQHIEWVKKQPVAAVPAPRLPNKIKFF